MLWIDISSCQVTSLKRTAANTVATFFGQHFDGLYARWIFYAVRYCGTVCYCLPLRDRCWGVPQITENSNCFNPRETLKYLQIKNVIGIFLGACVSGKTVLVLFLKVWSCKTEKLLLYCCGSLLNTGLKKILINILARNI